MTRQIDGLEQQLAADFEQHPDAEVIRSLPGLGIILSARVLGEFGDVPDRYADAKSRRNYAGTSPVTRASGTKRVVLARHAHNRHLADAIYLWAFSTLSAAPAPGSSTTTAAMPATPTTRPSEPSATTWSATSTAA
jgi:transposase